MPITITTGMIPFMTVWAIRVGTIHPSLATIISTAPHGRHDGRRRRRGQSDRMAPGAKWIGCRNMASGADSGPLHRMHGMVSCAYPIGGGQPDPTKAPDITNNSWHCPPEEGCSFDTLQAAVEAQAAAGYHDGICRAKCRAKLFHRRKSARNLRGHLLIGALNTGTDTIASFSSRGPVIADGSGRIKPDISAPGTNTRSCSNTSDSSYVNLSGTSMATPHMAGAMALLWNAVPSLRHQITESRDALNNSAVHIASTQCGDAGPPNNVYGWGRVDIFAAVGGGTPTPTPTPTATPTATPSASPTATATASPTSTPRATPHPGPGQRQGHVPLPCPAPEGQR